MVQERADTKNAGGRQKTEDDLKDNAKGQDPENPAPIKNS